MTDLPHSETDRNDDLGREVGNLRRICHLLHYLGLQVVIFTFANILLLAISLGRSLPSFVTLLIPFVATMACAIIIWFERIRRSGDTLFEEISDELQWHVRHDDPKASHSAARSRPDFSVRVALREFARLSDLPVIPGRFGPSIYIAVNVIVSFFALVLLYGRPFDN